MAGKKHNALEELAMVMAQMQLEQAAKEPKYGPPRDIQTIWTPPSAAK